MANDLPSVVARRIEEIRTARGLSRQAFGDKVGLTYLQVYRLEKGKKQVTADLAASAAAALEVEVGTLYLEARAS